MPINLTYPGVYAEVIPSQTRSVIAAATSNAAVIDWFYKGPINTAVAITSLSQFNSVFGGVHQRSEGSYAVQQFFLNGGSFIWVVRIVPGGGTAQSSPPSTSAMTAVAELSIPTLPFDSYYIEAANPGSWGNSIAIQITQPTGSPPPTVYTVTVGLVASSGVFSAVETYYNVSFDAGDPHNAANVINPTSQYVTITTNAPSPPSSPPDTWLSPPQSPPSPPSPVQWTVRLSGGMDGTWSATDFANQLSEQLTPGPPGTPGMVTAALDLIAPQVFNILLIPGAALLQNPSLVFTAALSYCEANRAFFIFDPPPPSAISSNSVQCWWSSCGSGPLTYIDTSSDLIGFAEGNLGTNPATYTGQDNCWAALYFPWLTIADPANSYRPRLVAPSGTVAGLFAANDAAVGVWKAPAGTGAQLQGATLASVLTDTDSGIMNPLGLNALRSFPIYGNLIWGARTLAGADPLESQFKYINVLRLCNFIEQSLLQSLKWAVFEPNAAPLWSSITLEVTSFMAGLFGQGAFQGQTAKQAYFVQCDGTTTTQQDILAGVLNLVVGFAPVYPAEFIVLQLELQGSQSS